MEILVNRPMMERMMNTLQFASDEMQDTLTEVRAILDLLEGGALLGEGGAAYADALRDVLSPKIMKLRSKFDETKNDIAKVIEGMGDVDTEVGAQMGF
ncbi:MAG: hypothetical protein SF162_06490 [bacterium]|nr:hypothetical protein [bacterium]